MEGFSAKDGQLHLFMPFARKPDAVLETNALLGKRSVFSLFPVCKQVFVCNILWRDKFVVFL
jgi:hypothetical protein